MPSLATETTCVIVLCVCVQPIDHKNIRRRVYDALNVLMAMNIISKEKKDIRWIGLPTNSVQECQHIEVGGVGRAEQGGRGLEEEQDLPIRIFP